MNYELMSDFEINKAVASVKNLHWSLSPSKSENGKWNYSDNYGEVCERNSRYEAVELPDYCNNPSDACPIIIENEIGINKLKCEPLWIADKGDDYARSKNPLRAAMIVFLMMNEK